MLIGLLLAAAATSASGRIAIYSYGPADVFTLLSPLILVAAVVFIPMLDMLMAVVRRTRAGWALHARQNASASSAARARHSQRRVALIIYHGWVYAFSVAASTIFPVGYVAPAFVVG